MNEGECLICKSATEREHQAVFANDSWRASLSANQGYLGTLFIELLDHKPSLAELTAKEWFDFTHLVRIIQLTETEAFSASCFSWSSNLDTFFKHPPPYPHVFWHVRPRYDHEIEIDGRILADPNFGDHYDVEHFAHVSPRLKEAITLQLQAAIRRLKRPAQGGSWPESPHPTASTPKQHNPK